MNVHIRWNPVNKAFYRICSCGNETTLSSSSNVILTRQTCGHRSSRLAGSKHRALAFDFSELIWYVFLIFKCTRESDPDLCMTSVLAKRMLWQLCSADFRRILRPNTFLNLKLALRSRILFASAEVIMMHRPRSDSPLHIDI